MTNNTEIWLVAAAVALAGVAAAPAFSAAMTAKAQHIAVMAPASPDALGTIWFDVDGTQGSGASFGGPR